MLVFVFVQSVYVGVFLYFTFKQQHETHFKLRLWIWILWNSLFPDPTMRTVINRVSSFCHYCYWQFLSVLFCNINIINQTDWQSLSGASVRVSRLPVPLSCCPRCKRLLWRRAPECVQLPQPHPGCGSLTEPAPAGAGCGSWLGLQGGQLGGLQQEGKQICERCDKEKNNSNDLNMNFIVKILQLYFLLQDKKF